MSRIYRTIARFHYKEIPALFKFDVIKEIEKQFIQQLQRIIDPRSNTGVDESDEPLDKHIGISSDQKKNKKSDDACHRLADSTLPLMVNKYAPVGAYRILLQCGSCFAIFAVRFM
jgi:hypothetical protein